MPFIHFLDELKEALSQPLPGIDAQFRMAARGREKLRYDLNELSGFRESAVCIYLFEKNGTIYFPLIERMEYPGVHSGQIALPGGKVDQSDSDYVESALRELNEEIGIECGRVQVIGKLTDIYIPPSNFLVKPVIAFSNARPAYVINTREVNSVLELSVKQLMDETLVGETELDVRGIKIKTPYFNVQGKILWGATAMILSEFKSLLQHPRFSSSSFL